jgi:hypothetical protein
MAEDKQYEAPAVYINRARVTFNPMGVRLMLAESPTGAEEGEVIRASFYLPHPIFVSIVQMFANVQAQIEKMGSDKADN